MRIQYHIEYHFTHKTELAYIITLLLYSYIHHIPYRKGNLDCKKLSSLLIRYISRLLMFIFI